MNGKKKAEKNKIKVKSKCHALLNRRWGIVMVKEIINARMLRKEGRWETGDSHRDYGLFYCGVAIRLRCRWWWRLAAARGASER